VLRVACPIVGSFGAKDRLRATAARLEQALTKLLVECDVKEYQGAGYAFMNNHKAPLFLRFLTTLFDRFIDKPRQTRVASR